MTAIDWNAAITALTSRILPCFGGKRHVLQFSVSLAGDIPADLRGAFTGLDDATSPCCSPPSGTQPENDHEHQASMAVLLLLNPRYSA